MDHTTFAFITHCKSKKKIHKVSAHLLINKQMIAQTIAHPYLKKIVLKKNIFFICVLILQCFTENPGKA